MAEEVRIWSLMGESTPVEIARSTLDPEARLEGWLEKDIDMLDPALLVIGRQIETDFGGTIDLLCVDETGDLVVVELKRDRTPREITAQVLDYGSWASDLSHDEVIAIAERKFGPGRFEEAFLTRFETDLPERFNQSHRLLIVGSRVDPGSERIVRYLSDVHGVNINVATFQYFKQTDGAELIARIFLIEPSQVERQTRARSGRRRNLSYEELAAIAETSGVGEQYRRAVSGLERLLGKRTTKTSIGFVASLDGSRKTVVNLLPGESNAKDGLRFQVYIHRLRATFHLSDGSELLPSQDLEPWIYFGSASRDYEGYQGFFATPEQVDRFVNGLTERLKQVA